MITRSCTKSYNDLIQQPIQQQKQHNKERNTFIDVITRKAENGEAVLFEVGYLGTDYQYWLNTFRVNSQLRFFESDTLEILSFCRWWTVPIVWCPAILYLVLSSTFNVIDTAIYWASGVCLWPPFEYTLHRYIFHAHTETYWWNTLHFLLHGNHHISTNDNLRLVFPPVPLAIIASMIASVVIGLTGVNVGRLLVAGLLSAYLVYDMFHVAIHSTNVPPSVAWVLHKQKMHHLRHHRSIKTSFGLTTTFLDTLLGTVEEKKGS